MIDIKNGAAGEIRTHVDFLGWQLTKLLQSSTMQLRLGG
jgi:hypothetical protein